MAGIEDVYERLINDPNFRQQLETDPAGALKPFGLSKKDLAALAQRFSRHAGGERQVEGRTSKSALINLIGSLIGGTGTSLGKIEDAESSQYSEFADGGKGNVEIGSLKAGDNIVDGADLTVWRKNFGSDTPPSDLEAKGFNPQPDPPGAEPKPPELGQFEVQDLMSSYNQADSGPEQSLTGELESKGFNPQPDPPGSESEALQKMGGGDDLTVPEDSVLGEGDGSTRVNKVEALTIKQTSVSDDPIAESDFEIEG